MKIVFIVREMDKESSTNNVIFNALLNINEDIEVISIGKSRENNYKPLLDERNIKYSEFASISDALLNLQKVLNIVEDCDIIHLDTYNSHVLGDIIKRVNPKVKLVSTCYSDEIHETELHDYKGDNKVASLVRLREKRNFYLKHDRVIAVSQYVQDYLEKIGCTTSTIAHNSVDYSELPTVTEKKQTDTLHLCQLGIMFRLKNQFYSVHLAKYLRDKGLNVQLHLIGNPNKNKEYVDSIKEFIKLHNLEENILVHGYVDQSELNEILSLSHIYLMPSIVDGLPLALLEAFNFKLPAIVSQYGGMKEVMEEDMGFIVNVDDHNDFEKIYQYCCSKKYLQDGENAQKIAHKKHNPQVMADKYLEVYRQLLDENYIFNRLNRKKVFLYPNNEKMNAFEKELLRNRNYIHGYVENLNEFYAQDKNSFDFIVADKDYSFENVVEDSEKIILI